MSCGVSWSGADSQEVVFGIYIDDLSAVALVPWSLVGSLPSTAEELTQHADRIYEAENWPRSTHKDQCDEASGPFSAKVICVIGATALEYTSTSKRRTAKTQKIKSSIDALSVIGLPWPVFWSSKVSSFGACQHSQNQNLIELSS